MLLRCRISLANLELDIDVSFNAQVTSIFGPSGSGKTTLLDAIAGLRKITAGEIEFNGKTVFSSARGIDLSPQERGVGYVPQEGALFPHLSVRKNILFGADRSTPVSRSEGISVDHVLEVLEIGNLMDRPVTKLSGGEAQRVALARAILSRPQLLLLDEPLAALDIGLKERILPYLGRVRDEFQIPMIYVTHNLTEVLTLADWVLMVRLGRLVAQGVPRDVLRSTAALKELEEDPIENVFNVTWIECNPHEGTSRVRFESGQEVVVRYVPQPSSRTIQIQVSADDILVATRRPEAISAANVLSGTVRQLESVDGQTLLTVDAGDLFCVRLTHAAVDRLGLTEESPVFLIIKTRSFRPA
ncbi:MAG: molybdenum ABC transporter ATP-binding protein [Candidatus Binatia bacterium]